MKVSRLAKIVLLPAVFFPIGVKGCEYVQNAYGADVVVQEGQFPNLAPPISAEAETQKYQITEKITDKSRIDRNKYEAYFKVDVRNKGWFYIVQNKNCRTNDIFDLAYDKDEKEKGLLFPKPTDSSKPVAVVDAKGSGLSGVFEIYDKGDHYAVKYQVSPLISIPKHTDVNSSFLLDVDETVKKLPKSMVDDLQARGIEIMLAKNIEDSYYNLYPSWKEYDENHPNDPKKPWLDVRENDCTDNRNYSNCPALYCQKRVIIPQGHYEYGTRKIIDRVSYSEWTRGTVGHELGHTIDYFNNDDYYYDSWTSYYSAKKKDSIKRYSSAKEFLASFEADKQKLDPVVKRKVAYLWCKSNGGESEGFADIFSALLGCMKKEDAALTLKSFPNSAEYIRKEILPKFGINLTVEDIRDKIYPDYLKEAKELTQEEKEALGSSLFRLLVSNNCYHDSTILSEAPKNDTPCCGSK